MEGKLCRTCGRIGDASVSIFATEGLRDKIETCLPIVVTPHCLLPDTICLECCDSVTNFYSFIKSCLHNIIILEAQFDVRESCLKTKRKLDKASSTDIGVAEELEPYDITDCRKRISRFAEKLADAETLLQKRPVIPSLRIVDYDSSSDEERSNKGPLLLKKGFLSKWYFADAESSSSLINEISERKSMKRKAVDTLGGPRKVFRQERNRRKSRAPVRVQYVEKPVEEPTFNFNTLEQMYEELQVDKLKEVIDADSNASNGNTQINSSEKDLMSTMPQVCLLCDMQFSGPSLLAAHVFETHGIDMSQVAASEPVPEKRKKLPNLVKITDLKQKRDSQDTKYVENGDGPPTLEPSYVCPMCPASLTNRSDLFSHLRLKHATKSHLTCGLCLYMATSYVNLTDHLETCSRSHTISGVYICKVCKYSDDNQKVLENHVLVHDFLISFCKKEGKIFDPADYTEVNPSCEASKLYTCNECSLTFAAFKEFSAHRRSLHSIFHCDLCNKFYGRNSHLWKHVNRLHKGHPSITCQFCYKTSASKYHLAQHFNKIHTVKSSTKMKNGDIEEEDFMNKKFEAFDFQSVRQSFMRQEMIKKEVDNDRDNMSRDSEDNDKVDVPKEIDTSSNLYTNIITNYTPPVNNGEFKCPKCSKGFHKKTLLKKHKKNCRPRLQKDLLTRCKSCSRIFKDRQSLAKHLVNYHSEYACELCDEKVQSKCEIVSHIRFNHPSCHLFCPECGNVLRNQEELRVHTSDHSSSFVCQFCADLLPSKIKLKMHILSLHRKILSLSCGVCLKLFETQHILRDHVRLVHRDVLLPLTSCTVCGKNYGSKWKTYDHINKSHGRIFRACKACLEVFDTERDLENHYEVAHANAPKEKTIKKEILIKKEIYESEPEQDDKNSSSGEESPDEIEEPKISLLEKRLTTPDVSSFNALKTLPPKKKVSKKSLCKVEMDYLPDQNGANTSKRTVYVNSNDPSLCEICLKTWPAKKHLWQHYIRCHKAAAATVCGICLKTNDGYEALQLHLQTNHPTLLHGRGFGSNFICRICGRYHNASSKLRLHMAIHENFNWSLVEMDKINSGADDERMVGDIKYERMDGDINYESLIEQVECSSDDSSSSSDSDDDSDDASGNQLDQDGDTQVKQEVESDDSSSSHSTVVKSDNDNDSTDDDDDEDDDDDDEEDDEDDDDDDGSTMSNNSDNTSETTVKTIHAYAQDPDVVDSAVKSICFEEDDCDMNYSNSDYVEVQPPSLNLHEIQSAVDSIL